MESKRFDEHVSTLPAEWFVDNGRPRIGEIWEDAEGVLYVVTGRFGSVLTTGLPTIELTAFGTTTSIDKDWVTKPLARAFGTNGVFELQRPLRYPDGTNIRKAG